jgi:Raf kinase inhibitor-like YbhB/YbcL family protein
MKKIALLALLSLAVGAAQAAPFKLASPDVKAGGTMSMEQVFDGFGCTGKNISPALHWSGAPAGTKSFALTVYDPDAPTGSGWWHWVIFNIPANVDNLAKNAGDVAAKLAPAGSVQSRTDFNKTGYGGPCPPVGNRPHRYIFTLYALKVDGLKLDPGTPAAMVGYNLNANAIAKTSFTARFGRK